MAEEETETKVEDLEVAPAPPKKKSSAKSKTASPPPAPAPVAKRYSFTQWAARRGIPAHHRGGLRAFVNNVNKHRTLEDWDKCFEGY